MAFPSDTTLDPASAWANARSTAGRMKSAAQSMNAAPAITRRQALEFGNSLEDYRVAFASYTAVPGIAQFARDQVDNQGFDIVAEYQTMRTQIVATQDWLVANFPNTGGELRVYVFDANKRFADINLTAGQLSAFKAQLVSLIATVA